MAAGSNPRVTSGSSDKAFVGSNFNEAFRIEDEAGISFWDALIVAAAGRSGATRVLSEDLNPGQVIAGVTVVNPLEDSAEPPPNAGNR